MALSIGLTGCVYYNTFYNARKAFNDAEKVRKEAEARGNRSRGSTNYNKAIEKSLKVTESYPNSKYYDDALYVLTVSYYQVGQYSKSERRAREILANYPESEYVKEAKLYLAKAKLDLGDEVEAMAVFEEIFQSDYSKEFKGEAALALGDFYYDNRDYAAANPYYMAVRDSLGRDKDKKMAQTRIADGNFEYFRFQDALSGYLQILGMEPDTRERYHALFQAANCAYRLQRLSDGQDYLTTLIEDDLYFDSVGVLKLSLAEGYEYDDELILAEKLYDEIVAEETNNKVRSEAFWRLGLMYQFDYDDLAMAKEYYDSTAQLSRSSDIGKEALQRSADIGKLEIYSQATELDSTATEDMIDEAAYTQYQLAELYWFQLNKPDSAILEMRYVVDSFPNSYDAPKAMIALSEMIREHEQDSLQADSIMRQVLVQYPRSDYVPQALERLGLLGTEADTGYAARYFDRAEDYVIGGEFIDSARLNYQAVVDSFPDSKHYLQSRFALIWLTEVYNSPGDSSVIFAYNEFIDSFPNSEWAGVARQRTNYRPPRQSSGAGPGDSADYIDDEEPFLDDSTPGAADTSTYIDPLEAVYDGPDGERLQLLIQNPIRTEEPFIYPTEAYQDRWEGFLYFQILLDFSGEVTDYVFAIKSPNEEINRRAEESVASMTFDPSRIPEELQDQWLVYKYNVRLPDHLR